MFCQLEILERMPNISQWFLDYAKGNDMLKRLKIPWHQQSVTRKDSWPILAFDTMKWSRSNIRNTSSIQPHPGSLYGNIAFASDQPSLAGRWGGQETARQDIFRDKKWGKWMRNNLDSNTIPPLTNVLSERCRQSWDLGTTGHVEKKNHVFKEHFV